jgi:hypothetical protein
MTVSRQRGHPSLRFRALKNIKMIEADHAPMTGGMDFSPHGVHTRYKSGYAAVDKLFVGGGDLKLAAL